MLNFKTLSFCFFSILFLGQTLSVQAQGCYVQLQDASGFDTSPYQSDLEAAACELIASFPDSSYADSFKVYSFGFYVEMEYFNGYSYPQAFTDVQAEVAALSPYYLLIGRQSDPSGIYTKFWVDVKLPSGGIFECLMPIERTLLVTNIKTYMNQKYEELDKNTFSYSQAEKVGMDSLQVFVEKQIDCCVPGTGNRSTLCSPCPTAEQIKNFFLDRNFEESEIEILADSFPARPDRNPANSTVVNYANELYIEDGLTLNPEQFLQIEIDRAIEDNLNVKAYITDNDNFCDLQLSLEIENEFDINQLDAAIQFHLWENPDTTKPDILFEKEFPDNTSYVLNLPVVTIVFSESSCFPAPLPNNYCPINNYAIATSDDSNYGYHCSNSGGTWIKGDIVEYTDKKSWYPEPDPQNPENEYDCCDGGADIEILASPVGVGYQEVKYIPSRKAYKMAVSKKEKYPTEELLARLKDGYMDAGWLKHLGFNGPQGTPYEDEALYVLNQFVYSNGAPVHWPCTSELSAGVKVLAPVQSEIELLEGIISDWLHDHDNLDSLFTTYNNELIATPLFGVPQPTWGTPVTTWGPNLTYWPGNSIPGWAGAILGGTQGRGVKVIKLEKSQMFGQNCYDVDFIYTIWDNFGVGMSDGGKAFFPGLVEFWVLQHYRNSEFGGGGSDYFKPVTDHSVDILHTFSICDP